MLQWWHNCPPRHPFWKPGKAKLASYTQRCRGRKLHFLTKKQKTNRFLPQEQARSPSCHPPLILQSGGVQAEPHKPYTSVCPSLPISITRSAPGLGSLRLSLSGGEKGEEENWWMGAMMDLWAAWRKDHLLSLFLSLAFIIPSDLAWEQ